LPLLTLSRATRSAARARHAQVRRQGRHRRRVAAGGHARQAVQQRGPQRPFCAPLFWLHVLPRHLPR
jgi:hypothetical protein